MAEKGGLQLLPETRRKIEITTPGENKPIIIGGVVLLLMFILSGGLYFYKKSLEKKIDSINSEIIEVENQRDKKIEENIIILNRQIQLLTNLLDSHVYWTKGLSKLESLMQNQVRLENLSVDVNRGSVIFKAITNNYTTLARQIASFLSDDSINDIKLGNVNVLNDGNLSFNLEVQFNKNKFILKNDVSK
jgi:hypothetical protein